MQSKARWHLPPKTSPAVAVHHFLKGSRFLHDVCAIQFPSMQHHSVDTMQFDTSVRAGTGSQGTG
eukprot:3196906-Amphidinium_carterae.1